MSERRSAEDCDAEGKISWTNDVIQAGFFAANQAFEAHLTEEEKNKNGQTGGMGCGAAMEKNMQSKPTSQPESQSDSSSPLSQESTPRSSKSSSSAFSFFGSPGKNRSSDYFLTRSFETGGLKCDVKVPAVANKRLLEVKSRCNYDAALCATWKVEGLGSEASNSGASFYTFSKDDNVVMILKMENEGIVDAFDITVQETQKQDGFIAEHFVANNAVVPFYDAYVQRVAHEGMFGNAGTSFINPYYFYYSVTCTGYGASDTKDFLLFGTANFYIQNAVSSRSVVEQFKQKFDLKPSRAIPDRCHNHNYDPYASSVEGYLGDYLQYQETMKVKAGHIDSVYPLNGDLTALYYDVALLAAYRFVDYSALVSVHGQKSQSGLKFYKSIGIIDVFKKKSGFYDTMKDKVDAISKGVGHKFLFSGFIRRNRSSYVSSFRSRVGDTKTHFAKFAKYPLQFYCLAYYVFKGEVPDGSQTDEECTDVDFSFKQLMRTHNETDLNEACRKCMKTGAIQTRLQECKEKADPIDQAKIIALTSTSGAESRRIQL